MELNSYSLLELAQEMMKRRKKALTLDEICDKVFAKKGIKNPSVQEKAQFEADFMLSGLFVYLGEDVSGNQMWDLKENRSFSDTEKTSGMFIDLDADNEDVIKNELRDDNIEKDTTYSTDDDDSEQVEDEDELSEELGLIDDDDETVEVARPVESEDEDEEVVEEDDDEIAEELSKRNNM